MASSRRFTDLNTDIIVIIEQNKNVNSLRKTLEHVYLARAFTVMTMTHFIPCPPRVPGFGYCSCHSRKDPWNEKQLVLQKRMAKNANLPENKKVTNTSVRKAWFKE